MCVYRKKLEENGLEVLTPEKRNEITLLCYLKKIMKSISIFFRVFIYLMGINLYKKKQYEPGRGKSKNFLLQKFFKKGRETEREFPNLAAKSYNELWKYQNQHIYKS